MPERTCVGCRAKRDKRDLIRLVGTADGAAVDSRGTAPGRGAYVCCNDTCWREAAKRGTLARALRRKAITKVEGF